MALHVVLGDGEMTTKELTETLGDLWGKAEKADEGFWFIIQGKPEPTATDRALVKWITKNELYFEVLTDDASGMDEIYEEAQDTHEVKRLATKVVNLLNTKPENDEEADILALFVSDDPKAEDDRWLNNVVESAAEAGFKAYALNDGLVEVEVDGANAPEQQEESVKKSVAKKVPAKKAAARPDDGETTPDVGAKPTREELEEMELDQLKEIAVNRGITLPPRTRMNTYIDAILGEGKDSAPEAEVQPATTTAINGNEIVDEVVEKVIQRLVEALQS